MSEFAASNKVEGDENMKFEGISDAETNGTAMKDIKEEHVDNGNAANGNGEKVSLA